MKNFVAPEHLSHFRKNQMIELEGLFTLEQSHQLFQHLEQALQERLKMPSRLIAGLAPFNKILAGRDLWRNNVAIRKAITNPNFLETIATLTDQYTLRLGYDQYLPTPINSSQQMEEGYVQLFNKQCPIEMISCLQGITAGALIALKNEPLELAEDSVPPPPSFLPSKTGNVVIFSASAPLDFSQFLKAYNQNFLLVVYTAPKAVYVYRDTDPNASYLKSLGYNLSDRLKDTLHPIVYRR